MQIEDIIFKKAAVMTGKVRWVFFFCIPSWWYSAHISITMHRWKHTISFMTS